MEIWQLWTNPKCDSEREIEMRVEPLETLTCQVCKNSFKYGGPDKVGYCREFCGPYCDGFNSGVLETQKSIFKILEAKTCEKGCESE